MNRWHRKPSWLCSWKPSKAVFRGGGEEGRWRRGTLVQAAGMLGSCQLSWALCCLRSGSLDHQPSPGWALAVNAAVTCGLNVRKVNHCAKRGPSLLGLLREAVRLESGASQPLAPGKPCLPQHGSLLC